MVRIYTCLCGIAAFVCCLVFRGGPRSINFYAQSVGDGGVPTINNDGGAPLLCRIGPLQAFNALVRNNDVSQELLGLARTSFKLEIRGALLSEFGEMSDTQT